MKEGIQIAFKSSFSDSVIESLVAFANTKGGKVIIGVDDGGNPVSIADLLSGQYVSQARNKKIAATFKEAQLIEKYGSGIKRIQEGFMDYGLKAPLFENMQHGFRVTVYSDSEGASEKTSEKTLAKIAQSASDMGVNEGVKVNGGVNGGVNEGQDELLSLINTHPGSRMRFFQSEMNVSKRTIERWLQKLRLENRIEYKGASKTGGYFIVNQ